jgi:hypothetical protein
MGCWKQAKKNKIKRVALVFLIFLIFLLLYPFITGPFIVGPIVNDAIARGVRNDLLALPLPAETEVIDSMFAAGNLVSQGNKIQYLGAILIRSELILEELNEHYSRFRNDMWSYQVREQRWARIEIDTFQNVSLSFRISAEEEPLENHFIVFTWGNHYWRSNFFTSFDIRAH